MKITQSRRQFIREISKVTLGSVASISAMTNILGCGTVDRYFIGDKKNYDKEVVILGAGLTGLYAALLLKKRKIPYRIFEAQDRVGGRIQSLQHPLYLGTDTLELGGQYIEPQHNRVLQLIKELNLKTNKYVPVKYSKSGVLVDFNKDFTKSVARLNYLLGQIYSDVFLKQNPKNEYLNLVKYPRAQFYDQMSLQQLFDILKEEIDADLLGFVQAQILIRYGVSLDSLSALQFLFELNFQKNQLAYFLSETVSVAEGNAQIIRGLYDRVSGVLQDDFVKLRHQWISLRQKSNGRFHLVFKTPSGRQSFEAKYVLCTLPLKPLMQVDGYKKVFENKWVLDLFTQVQYGQAQKDIYGLHKTSSATNADMGLWLQSSPDLLLDVKPQGFAVHSVSATNLNSTLQKRNLQNRMNEFHESVDWQKRPFAGGSIASYQPGQFAKFKIPQSYHIASSGFFIGGEHTSYQFAGTMEGALQAAQEMVQAIV